MITYDLFCLKVCNENTPECLCKKMCHPKSVSEVSPCKCSAVQTPTINTNSTFAQYMPLQNKQNESNSSKIQESYQIINNQSTNNLQSNSQNKEFQDSETSKLNQQTIYKPAVPVMKITSNFDTSELAAKTLAQANNGTMTSNPTVSQASSGTLTGTVASNIVSAYSYQQQMPAYPTANIIGQSVDNRGTSLTTNFIQPVTNNQVLPDSRSVTSTQTANSPEVLQVSKINSIFINIIHVLENLIIRI